MSDGIFGQTVQAIVYGSSQGQIHVNAVMVKGLAACLGKTETAVVL